MATLLRKSSKPTIMKYFRSFASYELPFVPVGEVSIEETEPLHSFYEARYDNLGQLVLLKKFQRVRVKDNHVRFSLESAREPGSAIYFEAIASSHDESGYSFGKPIPYSEVVHRNTYFHGITDVNGLGGKAQLFQLQPVFEDHYEYWSSGKLKSRELIKPDGSEAVSRYDENGGSIADGSTDEEECSSVPEEVVVRFVQPEASIQVADLEKRLADELPGWNVKVRRDKLGAAATAAVSLFLTAAGSVPPGSAILAIGLLAHTIYDYARSRNVDELMIQVGDRLLGLKLRESNSEESIQKIIDSIRTTY